MRIASIKSRIVRWSKRNRVPNALVLTYHRIATLPLDPQLLSVTPQHFTEHLEILRRYYRPTRLGLLAKTLKGEAHPPRSVVLTFDDGYADNLQAAKPLLARYDVPATAFIATTYVGGTREYWWDDLERLLLQPGKLPEMLRLDFNGETRQWALGKGARYSVAEHEDHRGWNVEIGNDPSPRQTLYRALCRLLRPLPAAECRKSMDALLAWAGAELAARPTHRTLSSNEVAELAEGGLVEVGSHSRTHSVLSALPIGAQRSEIAGSKAYLEEIVGRPVTSFAYPYGSRSDYTQGTVAIVQETKYEVACANFADPVWPGHDRFQLPRFVVRDCDGEAFGHLLRSWFHD